MPPPGFLTCYSRHFDVDIPLCSAQGGRSLTGGPVTFRQAHNNGIVRFPACCWLLSVEMLLEGTQQDLTMCRRASRKGFLLCRIADGVQRGLNISMGIVDEDGSLSPSKLEAGRRAKSLLTESSVGGLNVLLNNHLMQYLCIY